MGLAACGLLLAGCGFEPLYGENENTPATNELLEFIEVLPIEGRIGQLVRIELTNRLSPTSLRPEPLYMLIVDLDENKVGLAVQKKSGVTRANLILTGTFTLKQASTKDRLFTGNVRSVNSYDILLSDFATLASESDARKRGAKDMADGIIDRLSIFLLRTQDTPAQRRRR
jgi:LPS-assembly lipoprotein